MNEYRAKMNKMNERQDSPNLKRKPLTYSRENFSRCTNHDLTSLTSRINYFTFITEIKDGVNSLAVRFCNLISTGETAQKYHGEIERVNVNVMFIKSASKLPIVITNSESVLLF